MMSSKSASQNVLQLSCERSGTRCLLLSALDTRHAKLAAEYSSLCGQRGGFGHITKPEVQGVSVGVCAAICAKGCTGRQDTYSCGSFARNVCAERHVSCRSHRPNSLLFF